MDKLGRFKSETKKGISTQVCVKARRVCRYNFRLLDTSGWNFRHAHYHEEGRRTLYKAYGIKFVIIVQVLQRLL